MEIEINVDGVVLNVRQVFVAKDRPTIIFLHDSLGCVELWRDFPDLLAGMTNLNVLIYDRQGYGKSTPFGDKSRTNDYLEKEADILALLMKEIGLTNAFLFGHSDGGSIALIAASKYPELISGTITEGAHIFVEKKTIEGIEKAIESYRHTDLKSKLIKYHGDKTDAIFGAWVNTWTSENYRFWNIEALLPQIICPVLIIQGENDEYGTESQVDGIIRCVVSPAFKLMVPLAGHTPHKEVKEYILNRTALFLNSVAG